jgi:hypothetical protein
VVTPLTSSRHSAPACDRKVTCRNTAIAVAATAAHHSIEDEPGSSGVGRCRPGMESARDIFTRSSMWCCGAGEPRPGRAAHHHTSGQSPQHRQSRRGRGDGSAAVSVRGVYLRAQGAQS